MASPKAIKFEKELLALTSKAKSLVLANLNEGSDARQDLQQAINDIYERAHKESRSLRKALAFLHTKLEALENWAKSEHKLALQEFYNENVDVDGRRV